MEGARENHDSQLDQCESCLRCRFVPRPVAGVSFRSCPPAGCHIGLVVAPWVCASLRQSTQPPSMFGCEEFHRSRRVVA